MLSERRLFFMHYSLFFFRILSRQIKFCSYCFTQVFFIWESKKWLLVALDGNNWAGIYLGRPSIGRLIEVVVWTGLTVMVLVNWVQMFKCIISHSSTKSLVPPLHKFTIRKLDLFCFLLFGTLNLLNIAVYLLTCQYTLRMKKKLSRRKVGLNFAYFS